MVRFIPAASLLLAAGLFLPTANAAKIKVWHHNTPANYDKAQFKQAVVSSEGALRLARQLKPLTGLDATHVWDVVEDSDGSLFVATGDDGKVYKMAPDGKVTVAFESQESQIFCLTMGPDGSVYAGTGPSGLIVRIPPSGNARVLYDSPESYVWSLAFDSNNGKLYAGTGPKGRIYQVTPDGKASVFYTTKQEHILSLAMGPHDMLYAGTDKNGLVYRIDPQGKGFVLFQAPQAEVRSLVATADGIYAGTSSPSHKRTANSSPAAERSSTTIQLTSDPLSVAKGPAAATNDDNGTGNSQAASTSSKEKDSDTKSSPASAPSSPGSGENSLYQISLDGSVREIFRDKTLLLSLLRQDGRIFVGTGMEGQLFEVDEATKERSEIARLDHGQIHCMLRRRDGSIVVGTGDPGKLYVLQDKYASTGTVVSEILDAKIISKWGSMGWKADTPSGTGVTVAVRSGNVAEPDETWSDWSAEQTDAQQAMIATPTARFLQYRVTLSTDNPQATPSLHGLTLRYMTTNQAPEVTALEVPDLDAANLESPKKLKFKWTAVDPNEDELTYNLFVRKEGWKNWVELEDNLDKKEYEWDTTTTPSGVYQLKVAASDRRDNSADDALTGERVSGPFVVAHTPPSVTIKMDEMDGEEAVVDATANDPMVRLTSASFAVNGKKWVNVFPTDGLFDKKTASFRFKTDSLKPGTYVLVLKVSDAAGNTGSSDVVFTVQTRMAHR